MKNNIDFNKGKRYICYLSNAKIDNFYSQISEYDINQVSLSSEKEIDGKAKGVFTLLNLLKTTLSFGGSVKTQKFETGQKNSIQKLRQIIVYYQKKGLICDLEEAIASNNQELVDKATFFWIKGSFTCARSVTPKEYLVNEKAEADNAKPQASGGSLYTSYKLCAPIREIITKVGDYSITLACSLKYFSDMGTRLIKGEELNSDNYYVSVPHSGNYFFFSGKMPANFEALIILSGQDGKTLYGSPLVLVNSFNPGLRL